MGTVNYAEKYASVVDKRFSLGLLTAGIVNNNYEWLGVEAVKVFSRDLAKLNTYSLTGTNRYGSPSELGNKAQTMKIIQDKSFTFTIDKKSEQDTMGTMQAGEALREQIDNVIIPEIDTYRIGVLAAAAPTQGTHSKANHTVTKAITKANAYEEFLAVQEILDDDKAPRGGRVVMATPGYHNKIKLDPSFTKSGDMATQIALNGFVGTIDGVPTVVAPTSYFPADVDFIITNAIVMPAPIKLEEYKVHTDAPGISGYLVEGRIRYDAFALDMKKDAIGVHKAQ